MNSSEGNFVFSSATPSPHAAAQRHMESVASNTERLKYQPATSRACNNFTVQNEEETVDDPQSIRSFQRRTPTEEQQQDVEQDLKPYDFLFFAANSTFHGMSHIFTPGRLTLRKALWAVAFVFSLGLFLNQAYDRYMYYQSRPHVTKLDEKEVEEMIFPAVTICNMNSFRVREITTDDYFYAGQHILEIFEENFKLRRKIDDNLTWPFVQSRIQPILQQHEDYKPRLRPFNISEFYERTGHNRTQIVKQCKYRGLNCMSSRYWSTVYTRYGKCYTFNSNKDESKLLRTLKGGIDNGLEVLLDTEQDNYMPVWSESAKRFPTPAIEAGFKVQIHSQKEPPFIHELGFGISPGFQTLVATQEQRITFLPEPYGNCESGKNKSLHAPYDTYSISACRITCETRFVVGECGCRMVHMPGKAEFCSPRVYKECADDRLDMLVQSDENLCVCQTPCDVIRYNLEMSSLRLPSSQALSYMAYKYNKSEEYVRKNFVKLNIFFEALNYETIDQKKAYELPGLLGDIGGQMGLFIGASILTILELFDYLYEVIKEKFWRRRRNESQYEKDEGEVDAREMDVLQEPPVDEQNHSLMYGLRMKDQPLIRCQHSNYPTPKLCKSNQEMMKEAQTRYHASHLISPNYQSLGVATPATDSYESTGLWNGSVYHNPSALSTHSAAGEKSFSSNNIYDDTKRYSWYPDECSNSNFTIPRPVICKGYNVALPEPGKQVERDEDYERAKKERYNSNPDFVFKVNRPIETEIQ